MAVSEQVGLGNRFIRCLSQPVREALLAKCKRGKLEQNTTVQESDRLINEIYWPLQGMLSHLIVMRSGDEIETSVVGNQAMSGGQALSQPGISSVQVDVQIGGEAISIPVRDFKALCKESAELSEFAARAENLLQRQAQQNAACHALHELAPRLCRWLLEAADCSQSDKFFLTHDFLSHMMGVTRGTVTVSAHQLQKSGFIRYSRGHVEILNRDGLEECACECRQANLESVALLFPERNGRAS